MFHPKVMQTIEDLEFQGFEADHITENTVSVGQVSICFGHAFDVVTVGDQQHRCTLPDAALRLFFDALHTKP